VPTIRTSPAATPGSRHHAHSCNRCFLITTPHTGELPPTPLFDCIALVVPVSACAALRYAIPRTTPNPTFHQPQPSTHTTLASHASPTPPPQRSGKAASLMSVTVHESRMMPSYAESTDRSPFAYHAQTTSSPPARAPSERTSAGRENRDTLTNGSTTSMNGKLSNGAPVMQSVPNGRPTQPASSDKRSSQEEGLWKGDYMAPDSRNKSPDTQRQQSSERPSRDDGYFASIFSSKTKDSLCGSTTHVELGQVDSFDGTHEAAKDFEVPHAGTVSTLPTSPSPQPQADDANAALQVPTQAHRVSSPPAFNHNTPSPSPQHPYRLQQRHTLEVPKLQTSRAREPQNNTDDVVSASGRFSPSTPHRRRNSMSLVRRTTRSVNSDMPIEEPQQDEDAARWAEHIRSKRASKRKRKEDEDDDRVVVGTKVDQHHVNWVTAYNMLTGIRFTVSRTNAKMDRDLTNADFEAKHKFSFDMYVPARFPLNIIHLLEFSFNSSGRPVFPVPAHTNTLPEPATSLPPPPSTTSSSKTTRHGSSAIFAPRSSSTLPTTSYR
jgi:1-phosphatidylinositol-4-phosphate 5-kinase